MRFSIALIQSLDAIRANKVRAGVTIFIIALGITALVVVMTSIAGIRSGMTKSFAALGTNTFRIVNREMNFFVGGRQQGQSVKYVPIEYREAMAFKKSFDAVAPVSVSFTRDLQQVNYLNRRTQANIQVVGSDERFPLVTGYEIEEGRGFSADDIERASNLTVLGSDVKETLFPDESPVGKTVYAGGNAYRVIGVFKKVGTRGATGGDRAIAVPISTLRGQVSSIGSLNVSVFAFQPEELPELMGEAEGAFRLARKLQPRDPSNFVLIRSDAFLEQLLQLIGSLTISAQVIAFITLLGASVALLNVMLVSVTERTLEIGLRKALGASRKVILAQFLTEAILICQFGGIFGVLLGLGVGNLISIFVFKGSFVAPWLWMGIGLVACLIVGVLAGMYPAQKAASVDPIDSLRAM